MSSSKFRNMLLVAFAVLTIIFGSLFAYEFFQVQELKSISPTTHTTTVTSTTTVTTSFSTTTTSLTSTTTRTSGHPPMLYTNKTVPLDPALKIESAQSVLSTNNATLIAERLAYALDELPITAIVGGDVAGGYNDFKTAKGSWINITKGETPLLPPIEIFYYRWDWPPSSPICWDQPDGVPLPNFNRTIAEERMKQIMSALGVEANYVNLTNRYVYSTPSCVDWEQSSFGTPFRGTMVKYYREGEYFYHFHSCSFYFEFHPPDMRLLRINEMGQLWYRIPSDFPLEIDAQKAIDIATDYARNSLKMGGIGSPSPVVFIVIQDHLYYLVTVANPTGGYEIIVNPRTGEVGMPTISSIITWPETTTTETSTTTSVEENLTQPNLISSDEAVNIVMKFKGWNATQMSSYGVFTRLRLLEEEEGCLNMYIVDPNTTEILRFEASLKLTVPDPVVKLRGYYWYVDVNTNPKTVTPGHPPEAGVYYNFWVNAVNSTIMYAEGPAS